MIYTPERLTWPVYSAVPEETSTYARDKFGGQKAISSDMYFGRNAYDPAAQAEAQTRLQSFQGAQSISSNQYFGRNEEEDEYANGGLGSAGMGGDGAMGDGTLAGVEMAARDALQRVLANPDVQNAAESIRAGALKVRSWIFGDLSFVGLTDRVHFLVIGLPRADVRALGFCDGEALDRFFLSCLEWEGWIMLWFPVWNPFKLCYKETYNVSYDS